MKILHVGPTNLPVRFTHGGAVERRMVGLAAAQADLGHEVVVYSAERRRSTSVHDRVRYEAVPSRTRRPVRDYEFLLQVARLARTEGADVVHAHNSPDAGRVLKRLGVPAVLSVDFFAFRGSQSPVLRSHWQSALEHYSRILPVSEACAAEFHAFWGMADRTEVLHNGVDLRQFHPDKAAGQSRRAALGLNGGPVVSYVGRLCEQKGTDVLLEAWPSVLLQVPEAALVLTGPLGQFGTDGRDRSLPSRAERLGALVTGPVIDADLNGCYNAADVFVMPTVRFEMFGMAALEAQACGRPVVASDLGGLREAVGPDSGRLVRPDDPRALADAVVALLRDPALSAEMSAAARRHAEGFGWPALAERSVSIYESSIGVAA